MTDDIVRRLGFLCLGTRFKRIGERLQADVTHFAESRGLATQAALFPLLGALDRNGAMNVGDLAQTLGVSQPGVTRNVARLTEAGLIEAAKGGKDRRQKTLQLTKAGRALVRQAARDIWPFVEAAVAELCGKLRGPLLEQLGAIEDALTEMPLDRRAAKRATSRATRSRGR